MSVYLVKLHNLSNIYDNWVLCIPLCVGSILSIVNKKNTLLLILTWCPLIFFLLRSEPEIGRRNYTVGENYYMVVFLPAI